MKDLIPCMWAVRVDDAELGNMLNWQQEGGISACRGGVEA
jgi:hypothetical protein